MPGGPSDETGLESIMPIDPVSLWDARYARRHEARGASVDSDQWTGALAPSHPERARREDPGAWLRHRPRQPLPERAGVRYNRY